MSRYTRFVILALFLAAVAVLRFIIFDYQCCGKSLIAEGYPDGSVVGCSRTVALALCAFSLVMIFSSRFRPKVIFGEKSESLFIQLGGYFINLLTIGFTLLLVVNHEEFSLLSHEDSWVEWFSFVFLILSAGVFVWNAVCSRRMDKPGFPWITASCAALAFVFFFIGMEEVSWFQRQIGIETPVGFDGNVQGEFNLHNFFTVGFEILYYFGTFAFFMILPFLRIIFSDFVEKNRYFDILVPQPFVAVFGAVSCGYNFEMWNILPVQFCFVGALVLLIFLLGACSRLSEKILIIFTMFVMVASQWVFLLSKTRYERIWEVTEYKELFITIAFAVYAISTTRQIIKRNVAK